jgi:hypothetical protein
MDFDQFLVPGFAPLEPIRLLGVEPGPLYSQMVSGLFTSETSTPLVV